MGGDPTPLIVVFVVLVGSLFVNTQILCRSVGGDPTPLIVVLVVFLCFYVFLNRVMSRH